jgi:excisionase family DNA binding protein
MSGSLNSKPIPPQSRGNLLDTYEVAKRLGVSIRTVCLWAEIGELPGFKMGRRMWRFWERDINEYLDRKSLLIFK